MSKTYVATVMNRHYVGENAFIYNASHLIIGKIDEKTGIFRDRNGNEYVNMMNPNLMQTEIPYAYYNHMEMRDLDKVINPTISLKDKLSEYEYLSKGIIYYVSKTSKGDAFMVPLGLDEMRQSTEKGLETKKEEYHSTPMVDQYREQESPAEKQTSHEEAHTEEEYEECYETDAMNPDMVDLINKIIHGDFSLEELKEIKQRLEKDYLDLENVIDTLDLQIETEETGVAPMLKKEAESKDDIPEISLEESADIDIDDLFKKITSSLIAQDEAVRRIIVEIARKQMNSLKKKEGILITGSTGVGKTKLVSLLSKYLDIPYHKINATDLTCPGWVGKDIEEELWTLYQKCECDIEKTERAIIFFDEIDKKRSTNEEDHSASRVLDLLLPFIEGATYDACSDTKSAKSKVAISTKNMIVLFGGVFPDVYKNLFEERGMGFAQNVEKKPRAATTEDFTKNGRMKEEFIGRVAIVHLEDLSLEDLKRVMLESSDSALKIQEKIFADLGVKIKFTDDCLNLLASDAIKRKTGARGLNTIIDEITWQAFETVYKKENRGQYSEVIIDEETVKDPSKFQLVKRKRKDISSKN